MPVPENTEGVLGHDSPDDAHKEGIPKSTRLFDCDSSSCSSDGMHRADSKGSGSGSREDEFQLAGHMDDKELAERSSKEETIVCADNGEGEETREVFDWTGTEEVELVESGNGRDKDSSQSTGSGGNRLYDCVLFGSELAADDGEVLGERGREEFQNGVAKDGSKQVGGEGPSSFETCIKKLACLYKY